MLQTKKTLCKQKRNTANKRRKAANKKGNAANKKKNAANYIETLQTKKARCNGSRLRGTIFADAPMFCERKQKKKTKKLEKKRQ